MRRRLEGKLVIATHNTGKLAEMRELLAPYGVVAIAARNSACRSWKKPARALSPMP
jgi:inosine/xanthosine triphosphate pyrophosphatase family protein